MLCHIEPTPMNTDTNTTFMQRDMTPAPLKGLRPAVAGGAPDLLSQLERHIPDAIHKHAKDAYVFLSHLLTQPAEEQERVVLQITGGASEDASLEPDGITLRVLASVVTMAAAEGARTATERVDAAARLLDDRYQAGW